MGGIDSRNTRKPPVLLFGNHFSRQVSQAVYTVSLAQEATVSSTCRYDSALLPPSVHQSPVVVAVGCFDSSFNLNLVDAFASGVQGFSC